LIGGVDVVNSMSLTALHRPIDVSKKSDTKMKEVSHANWFEDPEEAP
jgi:hypothetical protein